MGETVEELQSGTRLALMTVPPYPVDPADLPFVGAPLG